MSQWMIITKDGQVDRYPTIGEQLEDGMIAIGSGMIRVVGQLQPPYVARPPKTRRERKLVEDAQMAYERSIPKLERWAQRDGCVVCWGNVVMGRCGQEFRETFATENEARERERQALAGEAIEDDRFPVPVGRERMGR